MDMMMVHISYPQFLDRHVHRSFRLNHTIHTNSIFILQMSKLIHWSLKEFLRSDNLYIVELGPRINYPQTQLMTLMQQKMRRRKSHRKPEQLGDLPLISNTLISSSFCTESRTLHLRTWEIK